jgi:hypothetical protein
LGALRMDALPGIYVERNLAKEFALRRIPCGGILIVLVAVRDCRVATPWRLVLHGFAKEYALELSDFRTVLEFRTRLHQGSCAIIRIWGPA